MSLWKLQESDAPNAAMKKLAAFRLSPGLAELVEGLMRPRQELRISISHALNQLRSRSASACALVC